MRIYNKIKIRKLQERLHYLESCLFSLKDLQMINTVIDQVWLSWQQDKDNYAEMIAEYADKPESDEFKYAVQRHRDCIKQMDLYNELQDKLSSIKQNLESYEKNFNTDYS